MELINRDTVMHANLMLVHDLIWSQNEQIKLPEIYVLHKWSEKENAEVALVRFEREGGVSNTFKLDKKLTNILINTPLVCMDKRILQDLQAMELMPYEFPKGWLAPADSHPLDGFTQSDLWQIDAGVSKLSEKIARQIKEILSVSRRLLPLTNERVYDLYMSFNASAEDTCRFKLRFDRIYPKLPEPAEGEDMSPIIIGIQPEFGLEPNDNPTYNQVVSKLRTHERSVNQEIEKVIRGSRLKGAALELLRKEITSILMATSHYTGKVFSYDGQHGVELLDKVANDILDKLYHYRKGADTSTRRDLRLDISSWFVWEYPEGGGQPIRAPEPELDFRTKILEGYTESFTDLLGPLLIDSGHADVISPYKHHVKADMSDGRAIGSMVRVKR